MSDPGLSETTKRLGRRLGDVLRLTPVYIQANDELRQALTDFAQEHNENPEANALALRALQINVAVAGHGQILTDLVEAIKVKAGERAESGKPEVPARDPRVRRPARRAGRPQ